jgi:predicted PhzF superfamily epimerase YddE/YHI9
MDFPATPPAPETVEDLADVLDAEPVWTGQTPFDGFAVLEGEAAVRALDPDPAAVAALGNRGLIVTSRATSGRGYDVVSRYFAPAYGIDEDPVTGSAHCAIGPFWAGRLGTDRVACYQASARGGRVGVRVAGDRVELTGRAVTVYRAELAPVARPPLP